MAEDRVKNLQGQMDESIKRLDDLKTSMREKMKNMRDITKKIEEKSKEEYGIAYTERLNILNEEREDNDKLNELPEDEKKALEAEFEEKKKELLNPDGKFFKSLKKEMEEFFSEQQKVIEEEQKNINETYIKLRDEELVKTADKIASLEEKLEDPTLDDEKREKIEKELSDLKKYQTFLKDEFEEKLVNMKKAISRARKSIADSKEKANLVSEKVFGVEMLKYTHEHREKDRRKLDNIEKERKKAEEKEQGDEEKDKEEEKKDKPEEQQPQQTGNAGGAGVNIPAGVATGGQQRQAPVAPAQQQQNAPAQPTEGQNKDGSQAPEEKDKIQEEFEKFIRYDGGEMDVHQAVEYIGQWTKLSAVDKHTAISQGALKAISKASEVISKDGKNLTRDEKKLLVDYTKSLKASKKEVAKEALNIRNKALKSGASLGLLLLDDKKMEEFQEVSKYFKEGGFSFGAKKPLVLYEYDKIPVTDQRKIDKLLNDFCKEKEAALKSEDVTAEEKAKIKQDLKDFDNIFGRMIDTGKANALAEELDQIIKDTKIVDEVEEKGRKRKTRKEERNEAEEREEQGEQEERDSDFEDTLRDQTMTDEEAIDNKEELVAEEFRKEMIEFREMLNEKVANAEPLDFEEYAQYKYYKNISGFEDVEFPDLDILDLGGMDEEADKIEEKVDRIASGSDERLTADEIDTLIGTGRWSPRSSKIDRYTDEETKKEYMEKYDIMRRAEKRVEENSQREEPTQEDMNRE